MQKVFILFLLLLLLKNNIYAKTDKTKLNVIKEEGKTLFFTTENIKNNEEIAINAILKFPISTENLFSSASTADYKLNEKQNLFNSTQRKIIENKNHSTKEIKKIRDKINNNHTYIYLDLDKVLIHYVSNENKINDSEEINKLLQFKNEINENRHKLIICDSKIENDDKNVFKEVKHSNKQKNDELKNKQKQIQNFFESSIENLKKSNIFNKIEKNANLIKQLNAFSLNKKDCKNLNDELKMNDSNCNYYNEEFLNRLNSNAIFDDEINNVLRDSENKASLISRQSENFEKGTNLLNALNNSNLINEKNSNYSNEMNHGVFKDFENEANLITRQSENFEKGTNLLNDLNSAVNNVNLISNLNSKSLNKLNRYEKLIKQMILNSAQNKKDNLNSLNQLNINKQINRNGNINEELNLNSTQNDMENLHLLSKINSNYLNSDEDKVKLLNDLISSFLFNNKGLSLNLTNEENRNSTENTPFLIYQPNLIGNSSIYSKVKSKNNYKNNSEEITNLINQLYYIVNRIKDDHSFNVFDDKGNVKFQNNNEKSSELNFKEKMNRNQQQNIENYFSNPQLKFVWVDSIDEIFTNKNFDINLKTRIKRNKRSRKKNRRKKLSKIKKEITTEEVVEVFTELENIENSATTKIKSNEYSSSAKQKTVEDSLPYSGLVKCPICSNEFEYKFELHSCKPKRFSLENFLAKIMQ